VLQVEIIRNINALEQIRPEWEALLSESPAKDFFITPLWMLAWWNTFKKGKSLYCFAYREKGELIGLFPLYKTKSVPFRGLRFIGQPLSADRIDFVLRPGREKKILTQFVIDLFADKGWDILALREFSPLSNHLNLFCQILESQQKRYKTAEDHPCSYVPTDKFKNHEAYYHTTSPNTKKNYRRYKNRIKKEKNITWEIRNEIDDALISEMAELDLKKSSRGGKGASFFNFENHEYLLKNLAGKGNMRVFAFRINRRLAAFLLTFIYDNRMLAYITAFDVNCVKLSIGSQIIHRAIGNSIEGGFKEFDMLRGGEIYKHKFCKDFRENRRINLYNHNFRARILYLYLESLKPFLKKFIQHPMVLKIRQRLFH
jgi:CelD/BcsL family acetyltransferase involved in cellulose biosynthesis